MTINKTVQGLLATVIFVGMQGCGSSNSEDNTTRNNTPINTTSGTIEHNGVSYGIVKSSSGRLWLDRNLGAMSVCDGEGQPESCYGNLYQWGRGADGHQSPYSTVVDGRATDIDNPGELFYSYNDWYDAKYFPLDKKVNKEIEETEPNFREITEEKEDYRARLKVSLKYRQERWMKSDGTGICPKGFRVPTGTELGVAMTITEKEGDNGMVKPLSGFLKLAISGVRNMEGTGYSHEGRSLGWLWTLEFQTLSDVNNTPYAHIFRFFKEHLYSYYDNSLWLSLGLPVRCIDAGVRPPDEDLDAY